MKADYIVYSDGGARGNPGPAGLGAVICDGGGKVLKEVSRFLGKRTNNSAEYEAVIAGFEALKKMLGPRTRRATIEFRTDSELVVRQLSGVYQIKEETLFPPYMKIHNFRVKDFPRVTFAHIDREKNKHADALANAAMDAGR